MDGFSGEPRRSRPALGTFLSVCVERFFLLNIKNTRVFGHLGCFSLFILAAKIAAVRLY
jgi:hypothetical protein